MLSAYQLFSQPIYDSLESWLKAWSIRRQLRSAGAAAVPQGSAASSPSGKALLAPPAGTGLHASPFDVIAEEGSEPSSTATQRTTSLAVAQTEAGGTLAADGVLGGSRLMSVRLSEGMAVRNSAPIPDLLPPGSWAQTHRHSSAIALHDHATSTVGPRGLSAALSSRRISLALSRGSMYVVDTGEKWGWGGRSGAGQVEPGRRQQASTASAHLAPPTQAPPTSMCL